MVDFAPDWRTWPTFTTGARPGVILGARSQRAIVRLPFQDARSHAGDQQNAQHHQQRNKFSVGFLVRQASCAEFDLMFSFH